MVICGICNRDLNSARVRVRSNAVGITNDIGTTIFTQCGHEFHAKCITDTFGSQRLSGSNCPSCSSITTQSYQIAKLNSYSGDASRVVQNIIHNYGQNIVYESKKSPCQKCTVLEKKNFDLHELNNKYVRYLNEDSRSIKKLEASLASSQLESKKLKDELAESNKDKYSYYSAMKNYESTLNTAQSEIRTLKVQLLDSNNGKTTFSSSVNNLESILNAAKLENKTLKEELAGSNKWKYTFWILIFITFICAAFNKT